jgi:hypothetical protein
MDDVGVRVAGGGVATAERVLRLLQRRERIFQQRALLDLLHGVVDLAIFGIGVLRCLVKELEAARIGPHDAEAARLRPVVRFFSCSAFSEGAMKGCHSRTFASEGTECSIELDKCGS